MTTARKSKHLMVAISIPYPGSKDRLLSLGGRFHGELFSSICDPGHDRMVSEPGLDSGEPENTGTHGRVKDHGDKLHQTVQHAAPYCQEIH
jgi:hypothetical protein